MIPRRVNKAELNPTSSDGVGNFVGVFIQVEKKKKKNYPLVLPTQRRQICSLNPIPRPEMSLELLPGLQTAARAGVPRSPEKLAVKKKKQRVLSWRLHGRWCRVRRKSCSLVSLVPNTGRSQNSPCRCLAPPPVARSLLTVSAQSGQQRRPPARDSARGRGSTRQLCAQRRGGFWEAGLGRGMSTSRKWTR